MNIFFNIIFCFFIFTITACSNKHVINLNNPNSVGNKYGFNRVLIKGGDFWITTYQKITNEDEPYVFYIEGDGRVRSKVNKAIIVNDPTPHNTTLMDLASIDSRPNVVYVARPCQYTEKKLNPKCNSNAYWTDLRFSSETVYALNDVIEQVNNGLPFSLVGYSGGGAMAVLIANINEDVKDILTIAGNLNHKTFTKHHKSRPIIGSLNPIDYAQKLNHIPQLHVSGGDDKVVLPFIIDEYINASNNPECVKHKIIPNTTHTKRWAKAWDYILSIPITCY